MTGKIQAENTLAEFLSMPVGSASPVLDKFAELEGAVKHISENNAGFVYVPGTRTDRVLLAAHADTVWDEGYVAGSYKNEPRKRFGVFSNGAGSDCGIGADDRAGCAILWLLRHSGHSLLVLDGEEHGQRGAHLMRERYPELFAEINAHSYMIQFDRRNAKDYKCYDLPVTDEFKRYIETNTGYEDAGTTARTDIVVLCEDVCGVNLSVGYHNEHTNNESIVFNEWYGTLVKAEKMLLPPQKRYPLGK